MNLKVEYRYFHNDVVEARVKELFEKHQHLCPVWLRELGFDCYKVTDDGDGNVPAASNSSPMYGHACIYIYNAFGSQSAEDQEKAIIHELVHIAHFKVLDMVERRLIKDIAEFDSGLAKYMIKDFRALVEEFTVHMTEVLQ